MRLVRSRQRGALIVVIVAFVVTRGMLAWLADHPETYGPRDTSVVGDPLFYEFWATQVVDEGRHPYSEVRIEYPPASLPFVFAPEIGRSDSDTYRTRFIALMLAVDVVGFVGLVRMAARRRRFLGCWLWIAALTLLGPICYVRLDLIPAVATIWSLERADAGAWGASGAALGLGGMAKIYPAFLLPALALVAPVRRRALAGTCVICVLLAVPFVFSLPDVVSSVAGYHLQRGIQVESTWGLLLLVASRTGYPIEVAYEFGAFHVSSGASPVLEFTSTVLSLAALGVVTWIAWRRAGGRAPALSQASYGLIGLLLVTGSVLSPQFLIWLAALGAATLSLTRRPAPWIALLLPAAALSQAIYPFAYNSLLGAETPALVMLATRNLLLLVGAAGALRALFGEPRTARVPEDDVPARTRASTHA